MRDRVSIIIMVFIIGPLLFQNGCGVSRIPPTGEIIYDIRGEWTINMLIGSNTQKFVCKFTGTKTEGVVTPEGGDPGTYKVGGETGIQVEYFFFSSKDDLESYRYCLGRFIDEDYMEGAGFWTWGAVRTVSGE